MSSSFDTLIIGGGLSGLWLTHRLHQAGQRVGLIEAREGLGGSSRRQSTVEFIPATQENADLMEWCRSLAPLPLQSEVRDHRPQMYDEGKWRPFAGFGETTFQSVGELSSFSQAHELSVSPSLEQLVRALIEQLPVVALTRHEVTSLKVQDGLVREVVVNGDKTMHANQVIFTPHPGLLNTLIEGEGLAGKHRTRLAKMNGWTSVALELKHTPPLLEDSSVRIFNHNAKEFEPVIGRVDGERSLWMTLVPFERENEHEFVGQCIRHIKRQLKRAWPDRLDGQLEEKIYVGAHAFGQHGLKTKDPHRFPEIANLHMANHMLASQPAPLGSLEVARSVEEAVIAASKELPDLGASC